MVLSSQWIVFFRQACVAGEVGGAAAGGGNGNPWKRGTEMGIAVQRAGMADEGVGPTSSASICVICGHSSFLALSDSRLDDYLLPSCDYLERLAGLIAIVNPEGLST